MGMSKNQIDIALILKCSDLLKINLGKIGRSFYELFSETDIFFLEYDIFTVVERNYEIKIYFGSNVINFKLKLLHSKLHHLF